MNFAIRARIALNNLQSDDGQTMAEYGIVMGVIGLVAIIGATVLGNGINDAFSVIACQLPGALCP